MYDIRYWIGLSLVAFWMTKPFFKGILCFSVCFCVKVYNRHHLVSQENGASPFGWVAFPLLAVHTYPWVTVFTTSFAHQFFASHCFGLSSSFCFCSLLYPSLIDNFDAFFDHCEPRRSGFGLTIPVHILVDIMYLWQTPLNRRHERPVLRFPDVSI